MIKHDNPLFARAVELSRQEWTKEEQLAFMRRTPLSLELQTKWEDIQRRVEQEKQDGQHQEERNL